MAELENNSGSGQRCVVPEEIKKGFNVGAFLLPLFWGIYHKTYIAILSIIPGVNLIMRFYLGFRGNALGWSNKIWESKEVFRKVQKDWAVAGMIVLGLTVAFWGFLFYRQIEDTRFSENIQSQIEADSQFQAFFGEEYEILYSLRTSKKTEAYLNGTEEFTGTAIVPPILAVKKGHEIHIVSYTLDENFKLEQVFIE